MAVVARAAGVSTATVSHVQSGKRPVAPATRAAVEAAIADLGFYQAPALRLTPGEDGGCRRLVLECSGVTLCDSMGLNCLLRLRREAESRSAELVLAAISTRVRHVLELTDALQVFVRTETVDDAARTPPGEAAADTPRHGIRTL